MSDVRFGDLSIVEDHCFLRVSVGVSWWSPVKGHLHRWATGAQHHALYAGRDALDRQEHHSGERDRDEEVPFAKSFGEMVGECKMMLSVFGVLRRISAHHFPVLITGESGTGKELAAAGIHEHSMRSAGPFVPVNCGAIAPTLFESELFGHEKGLYGCEEARRRMGPSMQPMAAHSFWMKSASYRSLHKRSCCGLLRAAKYAEWAATRCNTPMFRWLRPPTETWLKKFGKGDFERTCSFGSTC